MKGDYCEGACEPVSTNAKAPGPLVLPGIAASTPTSVEGVLTMKRHLRMVFLAAAVFAVTFILFVGFRGVPAPSSIDIGGVKDAAKDWWSPSNKPSYQAPETSTDNPKDLGSGVGGDTPAPPVSDSDIKYPIDQGTTSAATPSSSIKPSPVESSVTTPTSDLNVEPYINAILRPEDGSFPRLLCPVPTYSRYDYLRSNGSRSGTNTNIEYFFALDLYECVDLLPRLMGSIVEVMHFLGPEKCALSIVEGRSEDGTYEVLTALAEKIESIGAKYYFQRNNVNPKAQGEDRIQALADLRNLALQPCIDHKDEFSDEAVVLFINDVAICSEEILELLHQRVFQGADMTCAMDWTYLGPDPSFYDVWIGRGINGDLFFNIPDTGSWEYSTDLFWNDQETQARWKTGKSFQVYSCWNGATVFPAKPIMDKNITFRRSYDDECYQGEPQIFFKELWMLGYGKLAVVPTINLEYSDEAAKKLKEYYGYTSDWIQKEAQEDPTLKIDWKGPPAEIKCMPEHTRKYWVPWNETSATNSITYHDRP